MADTLLLVCPPDDPLGLLADSVGGGKVPVWHFGTRWEGDVPTFNVWHPTAHPYYGAPRALVLSVGGVVDEIGMGRALTVAARLTGRTIFNLGPGRENPRAVANYLIEHAPTYRLARVGADGRDLGNGEGVRS